MGSDLYAMNIGLHTWSIKYVTDSEIWKSRVGRLSFYTPTTEFPWSCEFHSYGYIKVFPHVLTVSLVLFHLHTYYIVKTNRDKYANALDYNSTSTYLTTFSHIQ